MSTTRRKRLRAEVGSAADTYWFRITTSAEEHLRRAAADDLAAAALKLHLYEQGYRDGQRERR